MLDIKFVRENVDLVRKDLSKRKWDEKIVLLDEVLRNDTEWRKLKGDTDALRSKRNKLSQDINALKKSGEDATEVLEQVKKIPQQIKEFEDRMSVLLEQNREHLMRLPNVMDESVPYGKDDSENITVAMFGKKPVFDFTPKNHTDLIEELGIVDIDRAANIAGARFYFLKGDLALLEFALEMHAIELLTKKGFTLTKPPYMMNRAAYEGVTDLNDFQEVMYKIEGEDLYLIATSEHPLTAMHKDEVLDARSLPLKLAGISTNFRKETGSHGKEEKGIWRVHQFDKIEQVIICRQEESWNFHEELIQNAIEFFESLNLHFRQVLICTGDLGIVAAKKYDLEAWIPSVGAYKEIASCSNCTAYQAVRLNIKYRDRNENNWVHTLNSTCVATTRALVAILEQFQTVDGNVLIPKALQKYMHGKTHIEAAKKVQKC